jgi:hypothetical protein
VNNGSATVATTTAIATPAVSIINNGGGGNYNDDVTIASYGAATAPSFGMYTSRGTLGTPANAQANDFAGILRYGTQVNGVQTEVNRITSTYVGNGTTLKSRLTFTANGTATTAMSIDSSGDVGIGVLTPLQTLHVAGTARITAATGTPTTITGRNAAGDVGNVAIGTGLSLTAGTLSVTGGTNDWDLTGNAGTNPATNFIGTSDNQPMVVRTNNTEKMRVTAAGNVGIGIVAPILKMDVAGGIRVQRDTLRASNAGSSILWSSVNSGLGETEFINYRGTGAGGFRFYNMAPGITPDSAVGELMRITGSGAVGIGTGAPAQTLDVAGTARITAATGTPTTITGRNAAGDVGNVALGTGLTLTAGTLSVTGGTNDWDLTGNAGTNPATNFIGTSDNQPMVVRTNNTEKVRVTAAGNVGIGTATPSSKLEVSNSGITVASTSAIPTPGLAIINDGGGNNYNDDVSIVSYGTSTAPAFGMFTSRGTLALPVNAQVNDNAGLIRFGTQVNGVQTEINNIKSTYVGNGTTLKSRMTFATGAATSMTIDSSGDVGIGVLTPLQTLHVAGTARITGSAGTATTVTGRNAAGDISNVALGTGLTLTAGTLSVTGGTNDWDLTGNAGTNPATNFIGTSDNQPMVVRTNNTEKVRVTAAGNVGIGIAAPRVTLDVSGGIVVGRDANPAIDNGAMFVWSTVRSGIGEAEFINYHGTGTGGFRFYDVAPLSATDTALYGPASGGNNNNIAFIAPGTGTYSSISDMRVKTNVNIINDGLDKVMAIRPVSYDLHTGKTLKDGVVTFNKNDQIIKTIGFLAQELEKVVPEAVVVPKDPANELYTVSYATVVPILTKAIQEQQAEIEALKADKATAITKADDLERAYASLAEQVKQLQQIAGISQKTKGAKTAKK